MVDKSIHYVFFSHTVTFWLIVLCNDPYSLWAWPFALIYCASRYGFFAMITADPRSSNQMISLYVFILLILTALPTLLALAVSIFSSCSLPMKAALYAPVVELCLV